MMAKKYINSDIVLETDLPTFNQRCIAALASMHKTPTTQRLELFGSAYITDLKTYHCRLRPFIKFMLDYPYFDDSLVVFYPYTPFGVAVVEDRALSHFLLYMFTPYGEQVMDAQVSSDETSSCNIT